MNKILVIGSINVDYIVEIENIPLKGETRFASSFDQMIGGKGANQAVCASRLGADVAMIGCVGRDSSGTMALETLKKEGVNCSGISVVDTTTGIAIVTISNNDNSIMLSKGANAILDKSIIDQNIHLINNADVIILQCEIPMETVDYVVKLAYKLNKIIILNPAPAHKLSKYTIEHATYITPNETEFDVIFKEKSMDEMLLKYSEKLIVTRGEYGVSYSDVGGVHTVPSLKVNVVDTTGAGDTFNGALAVALTQNKNLKEAVEYANRAAAFTIQSLGAQVGMPYQKDLLNY